MLSKIIANRGFVLAAAVVVAAFGARGYGVFSPDIGVHIDGFFDGPA
jgi:hypothetical protein